MPQQQITYNGETARANSGPDSSRDSTVADIASRRVTTIANAHSIYRFDTQSEAIKVRKQQAAAWEAQYNAAVATNMANRNIAPSEAMNTPTGNPDRVNFQQMENTARNTLSNLPGNFQEDTRNA